MIISPLDECLMSQQDHQKSLVLIRGLGGLFPGSRFMSNFTEQCTILSQENPEEIPDATTNQEFNSEGTYNISNKILTNYKLVAATYPLKITSSNLGFFNEMERSKQNNISIQSIATLKTYTFNNFRTRVKPQVPKSRQNDNNRNFFEKLKKLYRETIRIKTRKTIMRKKPFKLDNKDKEAIIDAYIEKKWNEAKMPLNIDPTLSNHLLKQAEKNKSADLNISLSCSQYPYIPCPLQTSENYAIINTCNYKHTSLAPLFTIDPVIINKDKKISSDKSQNITRCISVNFWNQFHSNEQSIKQLDNEVKINRPIDKDMEILEDKPNSLLSQTAIPKETEEKAPMNLKPNAAVESPVKDNIEIISKPENIQKEKSSIAETKPENIAKIRTARSNSVNLRSSKVIVSDKIKKTIFKHKLSPKDKQYIKHLDLNFPNKMTSPNLIKPRKKVQDKLLSIRDTKLIINPVKEKKVNIPIYTKSKLLKKIKKFYDQGDSPNNMQLQLNDKNDLSSNKNADSSQSKHNAFKGGKSHIPLTCPNNHKKK